MNKFATGVIAGSLLGAVGITVAMSDKRSRKKVMKSGKRMMNDAVGAMDDVKSKIW